MKPPVWHRLKHTACLLLSLILALGSVYQATMHLAHGTGTLVELCIDGQAATIVLGPGGEPQPSTSHDSTSCGLIAGFDRPAAPALSQHNPIARALALRPSTRLSQRGPILAAAPARAPPTSA